MHQSSSNSVGEYILVRHFKCSLVVPHDMMLESCDCICIASASILNITLVILTCMLLLCRQESCKKEVGNRDGSERMKRVVIVMLGDTGKQEKKPTGKRFQIYLDRLLIYLLPQWTSNPPFSSASSPVELVKAESDIPWNCSKLESEVLWSVKTLRVRFVDLFLWYSSTDFSCCASKLRLYRWLVWWWKVKAEIGFAQTHFASISQDSWELVALNSKDNSLHDCFNRFIWLVFWFFTLFNAEGRKCQQFLAASCYKISNQIV